MTVRFFGRYLVDEGEIDEEQLAGALADLARTNRPLGALAIEAGLLTTTSSERVNEHQRERNLPFGALAAELGLLLDDQVESLLTFQADRHVFLGEALVRRGDLDPIRLQKLLTHFKQEQALVDQAISEIPLELADEPFFDALLDSLTTMCRRTAQLLVKRGPIQPFYGDCPHDLRVCIEIETEHVLQLGLATSDSLAHALAGGLVASSTTKSPRRPTEALCEMLHVLATNSGAATDVCAVEPVEIDQLPLTGFAAELVTPSGAGLLVMATG